LSELVQITTHGSVAEVAINRPQAFNAFDMNLLTDSFDTAFERQLEQERRLLSAAADHPDGQEGLRAFVQKRKPKFDHS